MSPQCKESSSQSPFWGSLGCQGRDKDCHNSRECKAELLHIPTENTRTCWKLQDLKTSCFVSPKEVFSLISWQGLDPMCFFYRISWSVKPAAVHVQREYCRKETSIKFVFRFEIISQVPDCWNVVFKTPKWRHI